MSETPEVTGYRPAMATFQCPNCHQTIAVVPRIQAVKVEFDGEIKAMDGSVVARRENLRVVFSDFIVAHDCGGQ